MDIKNPVKLSPVHTRARRQNASFAEHGGWRMPARFTSAADEVAAVRKGVGLVDVTARGRMMIEGDTAESLVQQAWSVPAPSIGSGTAAGGHQIYRLRADQFFVCTAPGAEGDAAATLRTAAEGMASMVTVTAVTHGRAQLMLVGPATAELLSRLCGLDFHPSQFPNSAVKQSSVAKTSQMIIRQDIDNLPAYSCIGARSLAAYLWDAIMEAGQELAIIQLGWEALGVLTAA